MIQAGEPYRNAMGAFRIDVANGATGSQAAMDWAMDYMMMAFLIVFATVWAMEAVAWSSHKYVMHGFGWAWHRDHHEPHDGFFERNDLYAVVGAAMSISAFMIGSPLVLGNRAWPPAIWIGLGIMVYGAIYTLLHDGLIHQRWFRWVPRRGYAKRLVQAHKLHHATIGKEGGVSFGFIIALDPAWLKQKLKKQREAGIAVLREAVE